MLKDIFKKILSKKEKEEEAVEIEKGVEEEEEKEKLTVRVEKLGGMSDVERIMRLVDEKNILLLKLKELERTDVAELQNTLQKIKKICVKNGWDVVAIEGGYLIVTPQNVKIVR